MRFSVFKHPVFPCLLLFGLGFLFLLPALHTPYWGIFSDANQILDGSESFWRGDSWSKIEHLTSGLQRPVFHLVNYWLYAIFGNQPFYFYCKQYLLFALLMTCTYWTGWQLTQSIGLSCIGAAFWLMSSSTGEVVLSLDKAELLAALGMSGLLGIYCWGDQNADGTTIGSQGQRPQLQGAILLVMLVCFSLLAFFSKQTSHILLANGLTLPLLGLLLFRSRKPDQQSVLATIKLPRSRWAILYIEVLIVVFLLYRLYYAYSVVYGETSGYLNVQLNVINSLAAFRTYYPLIPDTVTLLCFCLISTLVWGFRLKTATDRQRFGYFHAANFSVLALGVFLVLTNWRDQLIYIWFPINVLLLPASGYFLQRCLNWLPVAWRRRRYLSMALLVVILAIVPVRLVEAQVLRNIDALTAEVTEALVDYRISQAHQPMTIALPFTAADSVEIGLSLKELAYREYARVQPESTLPPVQRLRFFNFLGYSPSNPNIPASVGVIIVPPNSENTVLDPFNQPKPVGVRMFAMNDVDLWKPGRVTDYWTDGSLAVGNYLLVPYGTLPPGQVRFRGADLFTGEFQDKLAFMPQIGYESVLQVERPVHRIGGTSYRMGWQLLRVTSSPPLAWNILANGWLPSNTTIFYPKELLGSHLVLWGMALSPEALSASCGQNQPQQRLGYWGRSPQESELVLQLNCTVPTQPDSPVYAVQVHRQRQAEAGPDPGLLFRVRSAQLQQESPARAATPPPNHLQTFPDDLVGIESTGIYPDGWMTATVSVTVTQPQPTAPLEVMGEIPNSGDPNFTTQVTLVVDQQGLFTQVLKSGMFKIRVPLPAGAQQRRIQLQFSRLQPLKAPDPRQVSAQLKFIGFQ